MLTPGVMTTIGGALALIGALAFIAGWVNKRPALLQMCSFMTAGA